MRARKFEVFYGGQLLGEIDIPADMPWQSNAEHLRQRAADLFEQKQPRHYKVFEFAGTLAAEISALRIDECQLLSGADGSAVWLTTTNLLAAMLGTLKP